MAYRGGYLPETRRRIERDLREGRDPGRGRDQRPRTRDRHRGSVDAVVCAGYPGRSPHLAALRSRWTARTTQSGGAGVQLRGASTSTSLAPLKRCSARRREARIDPSNVEILIQHLKCALFEAPFELSSRGERPAPPCPPRGEAYLGFNLEETRAALEFLGSHGLVHEAEGRFYWTGEAFPATHDQPAQPRHGTTSSSSISRRTPPWPSWTGAATHTMLHEQAIYQHDAEQYQVERLDYDNHKAFVRKVEPDYFTTALTYRTVSLLELEQSRNLGGARLGLGEVKVLEKVTGYKKIKFFTHENAGYGEVNLPELEKHTTAFTLTMPESTLAELAFDRARVIAGLRGLGTALEAVATLALMCDPRDINQCLGDGSHEGLPAAREPLARRTGSFDPTLFLFDAVAGGIGLAPKIFESATDLLERARTLIRGCSCQTGCPACIGPIDPTCDARATSLALIATILQP
jgi:DEAD/DEAH box helicase domain-containing protein